MPFADVLNELANLFDEGDEQIAKVAAEICVRCANQNPDKKREGKIQAHSQAVELLQKTESDVAKAIIPVINELDWYHSGYEDGRISEDVALKMQTVEIIGPDGIYWDDKCRVGLFIQTANTDYITRTHEAEELFIQIAGQAEWTKNNQPYQTKNPGDRMHHESYQPHASQTKNSAMVAAWVWWGNINYDTYKYEGIEEA